jgi:hypothetical protein
MMLIIGRWLCVERRCRDSASASLDGLKTLGLEQSNVLEQMRCRRRCWRTRWGWR